MDTPIVQTPPSAPAVYRCAHCSGLGEVPVHYPNERGVYVCNWQRCKHCNGTGQWIEGEAAA